MNKTFSAFLYREQLASFIVNAVLNGGFAWWLTHGEMLMLWNGEGAMGPDLLATSLLLAYLLSLAVAWITRRKYRQGKIPPFDQQCPAILSILPGGTARLALAIGGIGLLIGAVLVTVMHGVGIEQMGREPYVLFKTFFAGTLAIICNYMTIVRTAHAVSQESLAVAG